MTPTDRTDTFLVVGAGSSGLTAAKSLREHGFEVEIVEREDDLGGNWNFGKPSSRVYASTHMISSKPFTQYPDFPMPDHDPDYLHHERVLAYLRRYAHHFAVDELIEYETSVDWIEPVPEVNGATGAGRAWDVTVSRGDVTEVRRYGGLVIANGHNWYPKLPTCPGQDGFTGRIMHAADYEDASILRGRRVLVVGAGNTGCDIAVEGAQHAAHTFHSTRRGYWYARKYAFGKPADQVSDVLFGLGLPTRVVQAAFEATIKLMIGDFERYGLKRPDHRMLETHPIVNETLVYYVGHGAITPKDDVARFAGDEVVFTDGSRERVDLVIFATGYLIRFPFLDVAHLNWQEGRPQLYRHVLHPDQPNLAVIGLIQPDSGQFKLVHWQAVAFARYLQLQREEPACARAFQRRMRDHVHDRSTGGVELVDSTRHYVEVEHMDYIKDLEHLINRELAPAGARA